jgi:hypothetical protein
MPGDSGVTVVTNARAYYQHTRGCGRIGARHSLLPSWGSTAPSDLSGHTVQGKTRAVARRDREAAAANAVLERGWFDLFRRVSKEQLKHDETRLIRKGNGSALPLPPNSGLPELGIQYCRSRIYPTSSGRGLG